MEDYSHEKFFDQKKFGICCKDFSLNKFAGEKKKEVGRLGLILYLLGHEAVVVEVVHRTKLIFSCESARLGCLNYEKFPYCEPVRWSFPIFMNIYSLGGGKRLRTAVRGCF